MAYEFYLGEMLLPVTPKMVTIKPSNQNRKIVLINEGQVNLLKQAGLTEVSFRAHFPNRVESFAFYTDGFRPPGFFLEELNKLKNTLHPFQFIISRFGPEGKLSFDNNLTVSLEEYPQVEDATEYDGDVTVEITLCQARRYGTRTVGVVPAPEGDEQKIEIRRQRPVSGFEVPREMTVGNADTLWSLAKRGMLDGERFTDIYSLNNMALDLLNEGTGFGLYNVHPGTMLRMPLQRSPQELATAFMPDRVLP